MPISNTIPYGSDKAASSEASDIPTVSDTTDEGQQQDAAPIVTLSRHLIADYNDVNDISRVDSAVDGHQGYVTARFDSEFDSDSEGSDSPLSSLCASSPPPNTDEGPRYVSGILSPDIVPPSREGSQLKSPVAAVERTQPSLWLDLSDMWKEATDAMGGLIQQARSIQFPKSCQQYTYRIPSPRNSDEDGW
ncbi:hypothetical protein FOL47_002482, partial [Perkinsus chesapeaki]